MGVIIMGVIKEFRKMSIDNIFYYETYKNALVKGI